MKKSSLVVALTLGVALVGAAYADDPTPDNYLQGASTKSRDQVAQELAQAKRDGSIKAWSTSYNPLALAKSVKTRDEVVAELKAAQASGELSAMTSEDSGSAYLARAAAARSTITRVVAGTRAARSDRARHEVNKGPLLAGLLSCSAIAASTAWLVRAFEAFGGQSRSDAKLVQKAGAGALACGLRRTASAGPTPERAAACVAALKVRADALALRLRAGDAKVQPELTKLLEHGYAFIGDAYLNGHRDEKAAKARLKAAQDAQAGIVGSATGRAPGRLPDRSEQDARQHGGLQPHADRQRGARAHRQAEERRPPVPERRYGTKR